MTPCGNYQNCNITKQWYDIRDCLQLFLPTLLDDYTKPKVFDQIRSDYLRDNVWEKQNKVRLIMDDIETTVLLGKYMENDTAKEQLRFLYSDFFKEWESVIRLWNRWRSRIPNTPQLDLYNDFLLECETLHKRVV